MFQDILAGQREWERTELCSGGFRPAVGFGLTGLVFLLALRYVLISFTFLQKREPQSLGVPVALQILYINMGKLTD